MPPRVQVPRAADGHRVFKTNKFTLNIMVEVAKLGISLAFLLAQLGPSAGDHAGVERQSMRVAINLHRKIWPTTTQPAHAASQDLANNYTASAFGSNWWVRVCGRT